LAGCADNTEDRMWLDAKVNGDSVHLAVDTGSSRSVLFRPSAEDLDLKITDPPTDAPKPPGTVAFGSTEPCDFTFWGVTEHRPLAVADVPDYVRLRFDGLVGWPDVRARTFLFDTVGRQMRPLDKMPDDLDTWTKFRVYPFANVLLLETTRTDGSPGFVFVDTGSPYGVGLSPDNWRVWVAANAKEPRTLRTYYTPGAGEVWGEESWAHRFSIGPLAITEVPIGEAPSSTPGLATGRHIATLGMAALARLDFVLDGKHGVAYLRPKNTPPLPYNHNRLGAVFVPLIPQSEFLVAQVEPGGPAALAGIHDGDLLAYIDGRTMTNWADHPTIGVPNFDWEAGDKVYLRLLRNGGEYRVNVKLRDIIGPGAPGFQATGLPPIASAPAQ
jgi:hypothetical protein